ncbi:hypothetical protein [Paludisphaera mucosa]|uniref:Uncharacterized protein n=1 Tax=Paludisphaera mucosa TaxID=3030827 RepID=A0ABT6FFG3_9BACT|nr:hypothetical protein [Paludisphaera mucosa]MDG3006320.1 hypothetical protein [Paludisphaera mucosa]
MDDLEGDFDWELFPDGEPRPWTSRKRRAAYWLGLGLIMALCWYIDPNVAVVVACLAFWRRDFQAGRRLTRTIPDRAGGWICALFTFAWGAWKVAGLAFALMFVAGMLGGPARKAHGPPPPGVFACLLIIFGSVLASAVLTAAGLGLAMRSGMRVWIGEGMNRARTLLLGMVVVGFTLCGIGPMSFWMQGRFPRPKDVAEETSIGLVVFFACLFGGPILILLAVDWFSERVVAARPGKFGPKVSSIGKMNT